MIWGAVSDQSGSAEGFSAEGICSATAFHWNPAPDRSAAHTRSPQSKVFLMPLCRRATILRRGFCAASAGGRAANRKA